MIQRILCPPLESFLIHQIYVFRWVVIRIEFYVVQVHTGSLQLASLPNLFKRCRFRSDFVLDINFSISIFILFRLILYSPLQIFLAKWPKINSK